MDAAGRRAQDLQRAFAAIDGLSGTADLDIGLAQLEDDARVDHYGDMRRNRQGAAVFEFNAG